MRVFDARDYGFRKVVVICENPDDPRWVHDDGSAHDAPLPATPAVAKFRAEFHRDPEPGEWCMKCHLNWRVREIVCDAEKQLKLSDEELLVSIQAQLAREQEQRSRTRPMTSIIGRRL